MIIKLEVANLTPISYSEAKSTQMRRRSNPRKLD